MIYKTSGEVVEIAHHLAQVYNCNFEQFMTSINYLNDIYREIYSVIVDERDDYNIYTYASRENKFQLPDDLLVIKSVVIENTDGTYTLVERTPDLQMLQGCYAVENNTLPVSYTHLTLPTMAVV